MATTIRFEPNHAGIAELLKSPEVQRELERRARAISAAAGPDMEVRVQIGATRARASVFTASFDAILAESEHRALTRSIDAGRAGG